MKIFPVNIQLYHKIQKKNINMPLFRKTLKNIEKQTKYAQYVS